MYIEIKLFEYYYREFCVYAGNKRKNTMVESGLHVNGEKSRDWKTRWTRK